MKKESILRLLGKVAEDLTPVKSSRIAAAIVLKGDIISIGVNSQSKTDPLQAKYSKNPHAIYLHAEIAAIKKALKRINKEELKKSSLYIVRRKNINGTMCDGLAKPCPGCQKAIEKYQLRSVHYSLDTSGNSNEK